MKGLLLASTMLALTSSALVAAPVKSESPDNLSPQLVSDNCDYLDQMIQQGNLTCGPATELDTDTTHRVQRVCVGSAGAYRLTWDFSDESGQCYASMIVL